MPSEDVYVPLIFWKACDVLKKVQVVFFILLTPFIGNFCYFRGSNTLFSFTFSSRGCHLLLSQMKVTAVTLIYSGHQPPRVLRRDWGQGTPLQFHCYQDRRVTKKYQTSQRKWLLGKPTPIWEPSKKLIKSVARTTSFSPLAFVNQFHNWVISHLLEANVLLKTSYIGYVLSL